MTERDRAPGVARKVAIGSAALAVVWLAVVFGLRSGHPFALEWQEGGMLEHVDRVLDGEPLYAAPSVDHIAFRGNGRRVDRSRRVRTL